MPYEAGFYIAKNIVGYTGDLKNNPTVYFHNRKTNQFGRITQDHDHADNIGRARVRIAADYSLRNNRSGTAEEFYNGSVKHTSRNKFHKLGVFSGSTLKKLRLAIDAFPDAKSKYGI